MEVVSGLFDSTTNVFSRQEKWQSPVVALGNFDGVHLGHQSIIKAAVAAARAKRGVSICLTFNPHPLRFLTQGPEPKMLQTPVQKVQAIADLGVDVMMIQTFDQAFSQLSAEQFMTHYLAEALGARAICIGSRFHFGHGRKGNEAVLSAFCKTQNIDFSALPECRVGGEAVSSSKIRRLLAQGDLSSANALLGHAYSLTGTVVRGMGRGKILGFPTANLAPENETLVPFGVYCCQVGLDARPGVLWPAICNFGIRPTFQGAVKGPLLEVHLFDFNGDLYGQPVQVNLLSWVRSEKTFSGPETLKIQIMKDIQMARDYLK